MQEVKLWITFYGSNTNPNTALDTTKAKPIINKPIKALVMVDIAS